MQINDTTIDIVGYDNALHIYNCRVDVVRPVRSATSTGIAETTVMLVYRLMCAIEWKMGSEKILFDKETYFLDAILTCRNVAAGVIETTDRIVYKDDTFEIVGIVDIDNLGRRLRIAIKRKK